MEKLIEPQKMNQFQFKIFKKRFSIISNMQKNRKISNEHHSIAIQMKGWKRLIEFFKSKSINKNIISPYDMQNLNFLDDSKFEYVDTTSKISLNRYEMGEILKCIKSDTNQINTRRFKRRSSEKADYIRKALKNKLRKDKKFKSQTKPIEFENLVQNVNKKNNYFLYLNEDIIEFSFNDRIERENFVMDEFINTNVYFLMKYLS